MSCAEVTELITEECDAIKAMLLAKNDAYGNSALDPVRIFSTAEPDEQLRVRIDDKLSRICRGKTIDEDTIQDLIGYLILLRVAGRLKGEKPMTGKAPQALKAQNEELQQEVDRLRQVLRALASASEMQAARVEIIHGADRVGFIVCCTGDEEQLMARVIDTLKLIFPQGEEKGDE